MSFLGKFEKKVEGAVSGVFARAFKGDVQPVEIAARLQRELDGEAKLVSRDRRLVPNDFTIRLSQHDHDKLVGYAQTLAAELTAELKKHAAERGYVFNGPISMHFEADPKLPVGRFTVTSEAVSGQARNQLDQLPSTREADRPAPSPQPRRPSAANPPTRVWPEPPISGVPISGPSLSGPPVSGAPVSGAPVPGSPVPGRPDPAPSHREPAPSSAYERDRRRARPDLVLEVNGTRHPLVPPGLTIGRGTDADLRINDPGISRLHAEIRVEGWGDDRRIELVDLGSTNGMLVNGEKVRHSVLAAGTRIQIGSTRMLVHAPSGS